MTRRLKIETWQFSRKGSSCKSLAAASLPPASRYSIISVGFWDGGGIEQDASAPGDGTKVNSLYERRCGHGNCDNGGDMPAEKTDLPRPDAPIGLGFASPAGFGRGI